jgi:hypothetical protein
MMLRSEISTGTHISILTNDHSTSLIYVRKDQLTNSLRWIKAVTILERASKLVLLDPEETSEHANQWGFHELNRGSPIPPGYLESPRYRVPSEFEEVKYALEHLLAACGDDGVFPVEKKLEATKYGKEEVVISPAVILFVSPSFFLPSSFLPSVYPLHERSPGSFSLSFPLRSAGRRETIGHGHR